jgi:DNA-binding FrmR family transcriptional regulator
MTQTSAPITINNDAERKRIINRLRRLEGQVRGLQSMVESRAACEDVLTQVMACKSALSQVSMHVIGHAMKSCLVDETLTDRDELIRAAFDVYLHYRELGDVYATPPNTTPATPEKVGERLRQLEAELREVQNVISAPSDCENALICLTRASSTLNDVSLTILGHAMQDCLIDECASSRTAVIDQAIMVFLRYSSCVR